MLDRQGHVPVEQHDKNTLSPKHPGGKLRRLPAIQDIRVGPKGEQSSCQV